MKCYTYRILSEIRKENKINILNDKQIQLNNNSADTMKNKIPATNIPKVLSLVLGNKTS